METVYRSTSFEENLTRVYLGRYSQCWHDKKKNMKNPLWILLYNTLQNFARLIVHPRNKISLF